MIEIIKSQVLDKEARETIYYHLIEKFEMHDCDNLCECVGIDKVFDTVYNKIYPEFLEE